MTYADEVLFLDFDGVLHPQEVYAHRKKGIYVGLSGHALFEQAPLLEELLAPYPNVKVVLSTTWVRVKSFSYAKKQLPPSLQARVIGATYHTDMRFEGSLYGGGYGYSHSPFATMSRYAQIWRNLNRRAPKVWLALDDDVEGWPNEERDWLVAPFDEQGIANPVVRQELVEKLKRFSTQPNPA